MKRITGILYLILFIVVGGCFEPPQFSTTPFILGVDVRFVNVTNPAVYDTLMFNVDFRDGDGNIGVKPEENSPPFNERWYFLKNPSPTCETGVLAPCYKRSYIEVDNNGKYLTSNYITYSLRRKGAPYDTLPAFVQPYECKNYVVLKNSDQITIDTVYSQLNSLYSNLLIDLYIKSGSDYTKFDFNRAPYPNCDIYGLDSRVPVLAKDGNVNSKLPLEGVIRYKYFTSPSSFTPLLGKTCQARVTLVDREGNRSKQTISDDFTFN